MSDINEISVHVTVKTVDDVPQNAPPPSTDNRLSCEIWACCKNPLCFSSGCRQILSQKTKGVKYV